VYAQHDVDVACNGCSASYGQNNLEWPHIFERGENLLQNGILHNRRKSRWKVRKTDFSEKGLPLKELIKENILLFIIVV